MKIEIFDKLVTKDDKQFLESQRVQFIIEALGSLDSMQTSYTIYNENDMTLLPITKVDNIIVKQGEYPSNDEFMSYTGISFDIMSEDDYDHHHHDGGCSCGHCH